MKVLHVTDPADPASIHTYLVRALDRAGDQVEFDWADLFDAVLDKLGGSPCDEPAEIYTEPQAAILVALAIRERRCAELLNALANGGAVSLVPTGNGATLAFLTGAQVRQLARGEVPG